MPARLRGSIYACTAAREHICCVSTCQWVTPLWSLCFACRTCWFSETSLQADGVQEAGDHTHHADYSPQTTLLALEHTIAKRREAMQQPSGRAACLLKGWGLGGCGWSWNSAGMGSGRVQMVLELC